LKHLVCLSFQGITFGCAYRITGQAALDYLKERECTLGGYQTLFTKFYPRVATECSAFSGEAFPAFLYIATQKNRYWTGDEDLTTIAREIATSRGPSGHNIEYLLRLAIFMKTEWPGADDPHLFELERLVHGFMEQLEISPNSVMGTRSVQQIRRDSHEDVRLPVSFEHSSKVVEKRLRCLHI
jgi:glutathione-specific gamma-glutamylcyclotransferase